MDWIRTWEAIVTAGWALREAPDKTYSTLRSYRVVMRAREHNREYSRLGEYVLSREKRKGGRAAV